MLNRKMKQLILGIGMMLAAMSVSAQNIDFDFSGGRDDMDLAPGYAVWSFGRVANATKSFSTKEGGEISITISSVPGLQGNGVMTNWWKDGLRKYGYQLVGDMAINIKLKEDGNYENITSGSSGIQLQVTGLSAGHHSLLAYHSNTDGIGDNVAPLDVLVQGKVVLEGVLQRARGITPSTTPYSYLEFDVAETDSVVTIQYVTKPKEGTDYASTAVALNALQFDQANPFTCAHDPSPANMNYHVDADHSFLMVRWSPSKLAVKHHLMLGTESGKLTEVACVKDTLYMLQNLYSMNTYYWRVDEEDENGNVYESEEWSFRPRQLAFPGAEGYGRYATGGRGGSVYHVTNLKNDSLPGSLLYGLALMDGPRTIVFDVSGVIDMEFKAVFVDQFVTIAGQTAPGKGICLKHSNINICSDDICRFMRFKHGYGETGNAMGMTGADNAIVDHCLTAWGTDETVSGRGAKNISFQYNLIAEALGIADHKNYDYGTNHGYAATIDGRVGSWHHNLLAHCSGRNWSMGGGMDGTNTAIGQMDIFNNVVYNWNSRTTDGGCHEVNFVNNYYKMGPDTKRTELFIQEYENVGSAQSTWQAYISGNIRENKNGSLSTDKQGDTYTYRCTNGASDPNTRTENAYQTFVSKPFFPSYAEIHSAKDAFKIVNSYAGAYMPCSDDQQIRVIKETVAGSYTYTGSRSGIKGEIDHENDCGGFEVYPEMQRDADYDQDQDGIPTWFELICGSDPEVANNNEDANHDGWTSLEDYLEFVSHPYKMLNVGGSEDVDIAQYFAGFTKQPVYSVSVPAGTDVTATVQGSTLHIKAGVRAAAVSLTITVVDADGTQFSRLYNVAVLGEGTGIEQMNDHRNNTDDVYYDLYGRQTRLEERGFLIHNKRIHKVVQ